jgi:hypothetical protein
MREIMKIAFIALLFAASAFALKPPAALPAACGSPDVFLKVKLDKSQHTLARPEPGKATVYLMKDSGGQDFGLGDVTIRIGLDGVWVGANKDDSWFSDSVALGEHHVCAQIQPISERLMDNPVELAHFTAEVGKVYYFRSLELADSDVAKYLIISYPLSVSHQKK